MSDMTSSSTPSPESELQQETWELLLEVMSHGERHGLNSDILTPYHTKLLGLIAAHLEATVRSAERRGELYQLKMLQFWQNLHGNAIYPLDLQHFIRSIEQVPEQPLARENYEQLHRTPDSESENSDTVQQSKETSSE